MQQVISLDEIDVAKVEREWLYEVIKARGMHLGGDLLRPGTEIKTARDRDTNVTTLWRSNLPIAIAVRQRDVFNRTVLTMTEVEEP